MKLKKSSGSKMNKKAKSKMNDARQELADQISPSSSNTRTIGMVVGTIVAIAAIAFAIMTFGGSGSSSSEEDW